MELKKSLNELASKVSTFPNQPIVIVIKGRHPFITNLEGLDLSDCTSVLFMNSLYADAIQPDHRSHFDLITYFDAGEYWKGEAGAHLDEIEFPALVNGMDDLMKRLLREPDFNVRRVRLVAMEEPFVCVTAMLRQRYHIPGPKPNDMKRFTDKGVMKRVASESGVATAKYRLITPGGLKLETNLENLECTIPYPIVIKPLHGAGSAGVVKIENRSQLTHWITEHHSRQDSLHVAEEYIGGIECHSLAVVQESGVQLFPVPLVYWGQRNLDCMLRNMPMTLSVDRSPRVCSMNAQFVEDVVNGFQPPTGSLLFIETIMAKSGEMNLIDLACRVPGMMGSPLFQESSGLCPETVHMMASIREVDLNELAGKTRKQYFAIVVYPKKEGIVKELLQVPKEMLESDVEVKYCVKVGAKTNRANNVSDMAVRLYLWNNDGDKLKRECEWLKEKFQPVVMEDGPYLKQ